MFGTGLGLERVPTPGKHLLFHDAGGTFVVALGAVLLLILLIRYWPQISTWLEDRFRP